MRTVCPTAILREQATKIFDELIPDPAKIPEVKEKIMREALEEASSQGLTTIHTYAAEIWKYTEDPEDYLCLDRKGQLPLRVVIYLDTFYRKPYLTRREMDDPYHKVCYGGTRFFPTDLLAPVLPSCWHRTAMTRRRTAFWCRASRS